LYFTVQFRFIKVDYNVNLNSQPLVCYLAQPSNTHLVESISLLELLFTIN